MRLLLSATERWLTGSNLRGRCPPINLAQSAVGRVIGFRRCRTKPSPRTACLLSFFGKDPRIGAAAESACRASRLGERYAGKTWPDPEISPTAGDSPNFQSSKFKIKKRSAPICHPADISSAGRYGKILSWQTSRSKQCRHTEARQGWAQERLRSDSRVHKLVHCWPFPMTFPWLADTSA